MLPLVDIPELEADASSDVEPSVAPTGSASAKQPANIAAPTQSTLHRPKLRIHCTIYRPFERGSNFSRTRLFATERVVGGLLPYMNTWLNRLLTAALALIFVTLNSGCDEGCTDIASASVTLEVLAAEDQAPITDAAVEFTVDGGETRTPEYSDAGSYTLATEEDGEFAVEVAAEGFETVMRTYTVGLDADGCHVEGKSETIELARAEG